MVDAADAAAEAAVQIALCKFIILHKTRKNGLEAYEDKVEAGNDRKQFKWLSLVFTIIWKNRTILGAGIFSRYASCVALIFSYSLPD